MLSYRHGYHAGSFADLLKHSVLTLIIEYLKQKPAPVRYIDTHAGAGLYSTTSDMALKTGEFRRGAGSLEVSRLPASLTAYGNLLATYATQAQYPGSPQIAADLLRPQDELRLFELHSTEYPILQGLFARDQRVKVNRENGFTSLPALLPVKNARALVLIDPSYELASDYEDVVTCIDKGYRRMPNAVFAIWYPVVNDTALASMIRNIQGIVTGKLWRFNLTVQDELKVDGMNTTGMLVINPPWTLKGELESAINAMAPQLAYKDVSIQSLCLKE